MKCIHSVSFTPWELVWKSGSEYLNLQVRFAPFTTAKHQSAELRNRVCGLFHNTPKIHLKFNGDVTQHTPTHRTYNKTKKQT